MRFSTGGEIWDEWTRVFGTAWKCKTPCRLLTNFRRSRPRTFPPAKTRSCRRIIFDIRSKNQTLTSYGREVLPLSDILALLKISFFICSKVFTVMIMWFSCRLAWIWPLWMLVICLCMMISSQSFYNCARIYCGTEIQTALKNCCSMLRYVYFGVW